MRSMHRFFILALVASVAALFAAGTALAEVKVSGGVLGGLGIYSNDPGTPGTATTTAGAETSDILIESEATLDFTGGAGPVTARYRIRVRDTDQGFNNTRHDVKWNVTDAFSLAMMGSSFGLKAGVAPYAAGVVGHFTNGGTIGDSIPTQAVFFVNQSGMDANFKFGAMDAGLFYGDKCQLGGGRNCAGSANTGPGGNIEDSTIVPYFNGQFGAIGVHIYNASASSQATVAAGSAIGTTANEYKAAETSLGVVYKQGATRAVFQYITGEIEPTSAAASTTFDTGGLLLGGGFGPFSAHYTSQVTDTVPATGASFTSTEVTEIAVAYSMPIGEGSNWALGYASRDTDTAGSATATVVTRAQTELLFSMYSSF